MFFLNTKNILRKVWISFFALLSVANAGLLNDLNDVSYMWPPVVGPVKEASKLISLSQLIPESIFQEIISFSRGNNLQGLHLPNPINLPKEVANLQNWRLVAMRIDPCAPGLITYGLDQSKCLQEVRMIAQPFSYDGVWEYHDYALHIIFEVSQGYPAQSLNFKELVQQLSQLKEDNRNAGIETNGVPLRIHPGFKRNEFRTQLHQVLLAGIPKYNLKKITFTGAESEVGPWVFFQGLVTNHHFVLEPDPTLRNLPFSHAFPELPGEGGVISPQPTNFNWTISHSHDRGLGPSISELFYTGAIDLSKPAVLSDGTESKVFKLEDLVHVFENPNITNRTNSDCISCHTTMSRGLLMNISEKPNAFKYKIPNEHISTKTTFLNSSPTNFRLFGWFGSRPVISPRVINESADVADLIEKLY